MTSFHGRFAMFALVSLTATALIGCGSGSESADSPGGQMPVASTSARSGAGQAEIPDPGQLPSGFPADVPLYPRAETEQGFADRAGSQFVTFNTGDSVDKVHAFYVEQLENEGWSVTAYPRNDTRLGATKGDRVLTVMMSAVGGRTEIGLSLQGG
jgi:hypothetical protein